MNSLPDMIVLDFCEWLKTYIFSDSQEFDMLDILLDKNYRYKLNKYAEQFIYQYTPPIKKILHKYIESKYFDESFKCFAYYPYDIDFHELKNQEIVDHYFHEGEFGKSFAEYIQNSPYSRFNPRNMNPAILAKSTSEMFKNIQRNNNSTLSFLNNIDLNVDLEIDFLEWLIDNYPKSIDINKMPLKSFEIVVDKFLVDCDKSNKDKQKLIKSFKQTDFETLLQKLTSALSTKRFNKKRI